jgi:hypothetical protein
MPSVNEAHWLALKKIWLGNKKLGKGLRQLFWSVICFVLSTLLWDIAVRLVPMPEPYTRIGVITAFVSLGIFILGLWKLWSLIRDAGLKGVISILGFAFLMLLIFNLLTFPQPVPFQDRIFSTLSISGQQVWRFVQNISLSLAEAPEDFRFAYVGSNAGTYIPGFPTPEPNSQPILIQAEFARNNSAKLKPGGYAYINPLPGTNLGCFTNLDLDFSNVVAFSSNERLLILAGPKSDPQKDGLWWKLHGRQGDGWCREEILSPTR